MTRRSKPFQVLRNNEPIEQVRLAHAADPGISCSLEFTGWEAAIAAGLDLLKWYNRDYPRGFMAKVVAWHKLHLLVKNHSEEASLEAAKK